jgi:hypothetical protein
VGVVTGNPMPLDVAERYARLERNGPHLSQKALGSLLDEVVRLRAEVVRLRPVVEAAVEAIEYLDEEGTPDLRPLRRAVRALGGAS